jgi:ABC-type branched-subunit amino acid transport system ATPase component
MLKLQRMNQIKSIGLVLIAALFFSLGAFAQSDPAARQAEMKQKLITDLKMTPVQADSVVSIGASYMPQRREIFQDQSLSQDEKMAKMKAITAEADKRIQPVLGDPLFKQYQEWRTKNMQQMHGGKPGNN